MLTQLTKCPRSETMQIAINHREATEGRPYKISRNFVELV